jgi:sulfide dehydrogenase [flavocytochrome c] flavoprotein subunit
MKRRQFIGGIGALASLAACASTATASRRQVVVIGGGYGGATAAKYIRLWSGGAIDVTLVEPNAAFISCPLSNLVLGGSKQLADLTLGYAALAGHGVRIVRDRAEHIDFDKQAVVLAGGQNLRYDRLVLSPGVDFMWDQLPGMHQSGAQDTVLHAWKAGAQTVALSR